ncbi:serine/threonine protein kinase [Qipengyuania oceanensis]|uniref:Protein kinase n=1 Tax=Qipengyuania oceanensis TaxID=1463597 RepID=A0A844YIV2_9SPHN|nr:serine/threonine-protein kinase [Qipengyuania oceanensis]MXO63867.1 protein kinase [Qipengyuania oceanensis]
MTKAYSNKALPSGTILREWRLEEVLGVGGFGIVYKGRGIYFDELVAIKEYFPSSISERDAEATVVPIDSDAEEVHALGLKKFVEEAKLLWNLSTPSRHPNIVSVRSLFEVHGTAYMVMDFEDGVSLTDLLKKGETFDEDKLREMVLPVASGLERAHRVGVLHRDIKPSNILISESGAPVLIDFGSARFETEGVTSTTVTFHTPPYAAIEQYVKTYAQGPWTDIYALGVVLYGCITGEKPAEVLERLHGEQEPPLVDGDWPGYSRKFLAAVDAAMIIKPSDRPQSLAEWLAMFDDEGADAGAVTAATGFDEDDDEATRIVPMTSSETIVPVKPPEPQAEPPAAVEPPAPVPPPATSAAKPETPLDRKAEAVMAAETAAAAAASRGDTGSRGRPPIDPADDTAKPASAGSDKPVRKSGTEPAAPKKSKMPLFLAGAVVVAGGALIWGAMGTSDEPPAPEQTVAVEEISHDDGFGPALTQLVALARQNGIDTDAVELLETRAQRIAGLEAENVAIAEDPAREKDVSFNRLRIADITRSSLGALAMSLARDLTAETRRLVAAAPWADPRVENSAAGESVQLQQIAARLEQSMRASRQSIEALRGAESAEDAVPLAQAMITNYAAYKAAVDDAIEASPQVSVEPTATASARPAATATGTPIATESREVVQETSSGGRPVDAIRADLDRIADTAERSANEVIQIARARDPGRNATPDQKQAYDTLQVNAKAARDYKSYLDTLKRSARGAATSADAERLLAQGRQTNDYLSAVVRSSRAARAKLD